jgi:hypothetical protein
MGGPIDQESNPFVYIALAIACRDGNNNRIVPGYFYIRYTYVLKNPIGTGINYQNSQLTTRLAKTTYLMNASVYLCTPIESINGLQLPTGSRVDVEYDNNNNNPIYKYFYNGMPLAADSITNIWVLENQPNIPSNRASLKVLKEPSTIYFNASQVTDRPNQTVTVPSMQGITFRNVEEEFYRTLVNTSQATLSVPKFSQGTAVFKIEDLLQNFGRVVETTNQGFTVYAADAVWTLLKPLLTNKTDSTHRQSAPSASPVPPMAQLIQQLEPDKDQLDTSSHGNDEEEEEVVDAQSITILGE